MRRAALFLCAALSAPLSAAPIPTGEYVRARVAEMIGDYAQAGTSFGVLLTRDPTNAIIAERAMRQAILAGDEKLTLRAARALDANGTLPPDARLLLAAEAIAAQDWKGANAQIGRLQSDRTFAFFVPLLRAWIAVATHDGDPLALANQAQSSAFSQPLIGEQRALLLLAMGRTEEGVAAIRTLDARGFAARPVRLKLIAADALLRAKQKERALALLDGLDPVLVNARARIAAGRSIGGSITGPTEGVAALLVSIAAGFDRQRLASVGFTLARYATFIAPDDAAGWLVVADYSGPIKQPRAGLAALDHIAPDDPLGSAARSLKVALLNNLGQREAALAEATRDVSKRDPGVPDWARLGDINMALSHYADAAKAYGQAVDAAVAANLPAETVWPLLLQKGSALDLAGDWPQSKLALQKALALAPDQAIVLNQLGYSQIVHRDDVAAATQMIERASRLRPDDPAITDSLGWVRFLGGDVAAAVPLLEQASAGDPDEPTINEHLGDAYWKAGRELEARYAWRASLVTAADKDAPRLRSKIDDGLSDATASP
jgi:Flp pilus assembly protein TadD